jgi:hypothetical protein
VPPKKKKPANLPSPETIVKMQRAVIAAEPLGTSPRKVKPRLEGSDIRHPSDGHVTRTAHPRTIMISLPEEAPYDDGSFEGGVPIARVPRGIPAPPVYPLNARPDGINERGQPVVQRTYQGPLPEDLHNQYRSEVDAWGAEYLPLLRKSMKGRSL